MDTQSYGLFFFKFLFPLCVLNLGLFSRSDMNVFFYFILFSFFFFLFPFGYSKDRFLFKGDLYYHQMHTRRKTPRHGAFFHLEIPSVIISGRVASERASGGRKKTKLATARWRGGLFHMTFLIFLFIFLFISWV